MPPANSPSVGAPLTDTNVSADHRQGTPVRPQSGTPYLNLLSSAPASVTDLPSTILAHEEGDAEEENVRFLRSTAVQHNEDGRRASSRSISLSSNITPSERETARRLRRYVLQSGRAAPTPRVDHDRARAIRQQYETAMRDFGRPSEYHGWAPGSLDENGEPLMSFSDLRSLARGYTRGDSDNATRRHYRENTVRGPGPRRPTSEVDMDWEPSGFSYAGENTSLDSSLRTTALLQSVRRHARFSPRPLTPSEQLLVTSERERSLRRQDSEREPQIVPGRTAQVARRAGDPPIPPAISYRYHRHRHDADTSSEASRWLEEAIKYLNGLRSCQSQFERIQSAEAGGFVPGQFFLGHKNDDFIMDTTHITPPQRSSWLRPGSVFSGFQKSTTSINLSLATAASSTHPSSSRRAPRPSEDTAERRATSSTGPRGTWVERVMSRASDREGNGRSGNEESWPVKVTVTSVDYDAMTLTGTMEAFDVPNKAQPSQASTIATYLEGEIIDFNHYTLETTSYNAKSNIDSTYWRELEPFQSLPDHELVHRLLSATWLQEELGQKYILMRWKEKCFITPADAQVHLTISGFYYVSLRRSDGKLEGLYYDPTSSPYQHLALSPASRQFPAVEFR